MSLQAVLKLECVLLQDLNYIIFHFTKVCTYIFEETHDKVSFRMVSVSLYMCWKCMLLISTCAERFSKILTEWNEDVEFLSNANDLSHDSFTELHRWFANYVRFEFEHKQIQNQWKNPQKF